MTNNQEKLTEEEQLIKPPQALCPGCGDTEYHPNSQCVLPEEN
jgi:hypothetical protein